MVLQQFLQKKESRFSLPFSALASRGFTLIEIMVVMLIVAVMIAAVSVTLRRDYQDLVNDEMNRFQTLVSLVKDEAVFQARSLAIGFEKNSYVFMTYADNKTWKPLEDEKLSQYTMPKNIEIDVLRDGLPVKYREKKADKPQVFLFSTGEITPFEIGITYPGRASVRVKFDALGRAKKRVEDE
jgi:general secretion pathway protein H